MQLNTTKHVAVALSVVRDLSRQDLELLAVGQWVNIIVMAKGSTEEECDAWGEEVESLISNGALSSVVLEIQHRVQDRIEIEMEG